MKAMCGIAGLVRRHGSDGPNVLEAITAAMVHRGPDGEGIYRDDYVSIGMRRLSIIDLTGGWQPLYNEDRTIAMVANGEIYNFLELRAELQLRGHRFATRWRDRPIARWSSGCRAHRA